MDENGTGCWQASSKEMKERVAKNKKRIQDSFKKELGLRIDIPKEGGGTPNDGNIARRYSENVAVTAKILNVDEELMTKCRTILRALSSGIAININNFKNLCFNVAQLYVEKYEWYSMPASVYTALINRHRIIDCAPLPIGKLSEDAQESRNKDIRNYRESFSRKFSRQETMEDVSFRLLVSSDPLISSLQKIKSKNEKPFDKELLSLLHFPSYEVNDDSAEEFLSSEVDN